MCVPEYVATIFHLWRAYFSTVGSAKLRAFVQRTTAKEAPSRVEWSRMHYSNVSLPPPYLEMTLQHCSIIPPPLSFFCCNAILYFPRISHAPCSHRRRRLAAPLLQQRPCKNSAPFAQPTLQLVHVRWRRHRERKERVKAKKLAKHSLPPVCGKTRPSLFSTLSRI